MTTPPNNNNDDDRPITILWATQSGRAKACARRTIRLLHSSLGITPNNIQGQCSFDDFGADRFLSLGQHRQQQQQTDLLLMFVSTTGDAEQCTSIASTWSKLLSKSLPHTTFQHCQFALFSLGDRAYGPDAFCAAGRKVAARLNQLRAMPICTLGYGDDGSLNGGVFADLDVWLEEQLFPTVKTMIGSGQLNVLFDNTSSSPSSSSLLQVNHEKEVKMYTVKAIHQSDAVAGKEVASLQHHEWQNERYQQHYANHFKHSCPATAYQYNGELKRRTNSKNNANQLDCKTPPLIGRVTVNKRITADDWMQNTRHIRINVTSSMKGDKPPTPLGTRSVITEQEESLLLPSYYQAGDVATILPSNPSSVVSRFLSVLPTAIRSIADETIHIQYNPNHSQTSSMNNHPWPQYCTLRGLLTHCADIQSLPEREDLFAVSSFCNPNHDEGKDQREKLISLSETSGAALYGDYIIREKRNWVDVLYDFDSIRYEQEDGVKLTLEDLLSLLPSLAPRHFSIASSPSFIQMNQSPTIAKGFELELCVAVVEGSTPFGRQYSGCCSKYLESISPCSDHSDGSDAVRLWIHPGSFSNLPLDIRDNPTPHGYFTTPVMYVGAGTGIAPLRSLILEREATRMKNGATPTSSSVVATVNNGDENDDNILVFGCRSKAKDYYYGEEWEEFVTTKRLRMIPAFSRDQKVGKLYVQRALREAGGGSGKLIIQHILEHNGAVYIAGGSKMARAVKDEIVEALAKTLGSEKTAKKLLNKLKRAGQFSIEAWS
jgi:sulfite reductase alpha subunit-like flavoprotein